MARLRVYIVYFPAHCVCVSNVSFQYNLTPAMKIYHGHQRMISTRASHKDYQLIIIIFFDPRYRYDPEGI